MSQYLNVKIEFVFHLFVQVPDSVELGLFDLCFSFYCLNIQVTLLNQGHW